MSTAANTSVTVDDDLRVQVLDEHGHAVVARLTPSQALALSEDLVRRGFRKMMTEEATLADLVPEAAH